MSHTDTGGPAFPCDRHATNANSGMTLRDYFAARVLQGIWSDTQMLAVISRGDRGRLAEIAANSYEMADAMLKARSA